MIPTTINKKPNKKIINFITNDTKKKLKESGWKIIGGEKKWVKSCSTCENKIYYKSIYNFYIGIEKNTICSKCRAGNASRGNTWTDKRKIEWLTKCKTLFTNKNNPSHRLEIKNRISKFRTGSKMSNETKQKISKKVSGKNNPRYGKSPPKSSGSGWSCRYKNLYFRSLKELIFFIKKENENIKCECVEHKISIKYKNKLGMDRTYRPDFLVNNNILVEIKPRYLWDDVDVRLKKDAAEKFCKENGYQYQLIDVEPDSKSLKEKYLNGEIKFVEKYKERFEKYAGIK